MEKEKEKKNPRAELEKNEVLVRIFGYDIVGSKNIYTALTKIKGISWTVSNAICIKLKLDKKRKVESFSKDEINKIESFIKELPIYDYLKNRRNDVESGQTKHYLSTDLDIRKEFDIKRLKSIKSYRGFRHSAKLPSRGQRTRSHFRTRKITMGVRRKK